MAAERCRCFAAAEVHEADLSWLEGCVWICVGEVGVVEHFRLTIGGEVGHFVRWRGVFCETCRTNRENKISRQRRTCKLIEITK